MHFSEPLIIRQKDKEKTFVVFSRCRHRILNNKVQFKDLFLSQSALVLSGVSIRDFLLCKTPEADL